MRNSISRSPSKMRSAQAAQVFHFHELGPAHIIGGEVRGRAPAAIFLRISLRSVVSSILAGPALTPFNFRSERAEVRMKAAVVEKTTSPTSHSAPPTGSSGGLDLSGADGSLDLRGPFVGGINRSRDGQQEKQ